LALTAKNDDPILWGRLALRLPGGPLQMLSPLLDPVNGPFLLAISSFLLVLLTRMSTRTGRLQAVLITVVSCAVYPVVQVILLLNLLPPPAVRSAVGYAGYSGYAKANEYLSVMIAMLVCIGLSYSLARMAGNEPGESEAPALPPSKRRNVWLVH